MQAFEWRENLRINAVNGINNLDYYHHMNDYYTSMIDIKKRSLPERPPNPAADLADAETQKVLRNIMNQAKRSMGFSSKKVKANGS